MMLSHFLYVANTVKDIAEPGDHFIIDPRWKCIYYSRYVSGGEFNSFVLVLSDDDNDLLRLKLCGFETTLGFENYEELEDLLITTKSKMQLHRNDNQMWVPYRNCKPTFEVSSPSINCDKTRGSLYFHCKQLFKQSKKRKRTATKYDRRISRKIHCENDS